jgi:hypothetical protein
MILDHKSKKRPARRYVTCPCGSGRTSRWVFDNPEEPNAGRRVCEVCRPQYNHPAPTRFLYGKKDSHGG